MKHLLPNKVACIMLKSLAIYASPRIGTVLALSGGSSRKQLAQQTINQFGGQGNENETDLV